MAGEWIRGRSMLLTFCFLFIIVFFVSDLSYAQISGSVSQKVPVQNIIEKHARQDVELNKSRASVSDLNTLFGKESGLAGLKMREVQNIYNNAYTVATDAKPWWIRLKPDANWITALIVGVLLLWGEVFKGYIKHFFTWLTEGVYSRLAGYKIFWVISLGRYRRSLMREHRVLVIPFRSNNRNHDK